MPVGRQAQTLLGALSRRWDELTAIAGPFTPYIAIPEPGPATWAHDPSQLAESRQLITVRGGQIIPSAMTRGRVLVRARVAAVVGRGRVIQPASRTSRRARSRRSAARRCIPRRPQRRLRGTFVASDSG